MDEFWNDFEQFWAGNDQWIWIVLGLALAIIAVALVAGYVRARKRGLDRTHAAAIREDAARQDAVLGRKDAETRRLEAKADEAQAEADRLHALAEERRRQLKQERAEQVDRLHEAEELEHGTKYAATHRE
jgi:type VI protein secretion system component VasK